MPGNYKLEVQITNRETSRTYKGEQKIVHFASCGGTMMSSFGCGFGATAGVIKAGLPLAVVLFGEYVGERALSAASLASGETMFGLLLIDTLGKTPHELFPTDLADALVRGCQLSLDTGQATTTEHGCTLPGGSRLTNIALSERAGD